MIRISQLFIIFTFLFSTVFPAAGEVHPLTSKSKYWKIVSHQFLELVKEESGYSREYLKEKMEEEGRIIGQVVVNKAGNSFVLVSAEIGSVLFGISQDGKVVWRNTRLAKNEFLVVDPVEGVISSKLAGDERGNALLIWRRREENQNLDEFINARLINPYGHVVWDRILLKNEPVAFFQIKNWPKQGWLITFATIGHEIKDGRMVAQLLNTQGQKRWGEKGLTLGVNGSYSGKNLVFPIQDTPDTFFLLWHDNPPKYQAQRVDAQGRFLWPKPVVLGEGSEDFSPWGKFSKIRLTLAPNSQVEAVLYRGIANDAHVDLEKYRVLVSPDGKVERK